MTGETQQRTLAHDVGGSTEFGLVDTHDGPSFHHEWEARIFAMNRALLARGAYTLDEFRDALERSCAHDYRELSYYERWVRAVETLLTEKGVA